MRIFSNSSNALRSKIDSVNEELQELDNKAQWDADDVERENILLGQLSDLENELDEVTRAEKLSA